MTFVLSHWVHLARLDIWINSIMESGEEEISQGLQLLLFSNDNVEEWGGNPGLDLPEHPSDKNRRFYYGFCASVRLVPGRLSEWGGQEVDESTNCL